MRASAPTGRWCRGRSPNRPVKTASHSQRFQFRRERALADGQQAVARPRAAADRAGVEQRQPAVLLQTRAVRVPVERDGRAGAQRRLAQRVQLRLVLDIERVPVRGGTDGSRLSYRGLPCPNLGTGGACFHGPFEHISAENMALAVTILKNLLTA